jgi:uncharacterized protein GlcG (DUF336 family)
MSSEKARARPSVQKSRPEEFRQAIEKAEAEGAARDDMVLRLTLRDAADLKRDRSVPVEDISFVGGVMRYIGVQVTPGGVGVSGLQTRAEADAEAAVLAAAAAPPKKK